MAFDLILRAARISGREDNVDIGIADGRIAAIEPTLPAGGPEEMIGGCLVAPGFVETHIHVDKSRISDRCTIREGTLQEAIAETARAKGAFTEEDIVARARRTLEQAILNGAMHMRTHTGYALQDKDIQDLWHLHERFGAEYPAEHAHLRTRPAV